MEDLDLVSRQSSLRLLYGLGKIVNVNDREILEDKFNQFKTMLSQVDKTLHNRELVPEETVQVLRRYHRELEQLWLSSDIRRYFEIRSAQDLSRLQPEAALDACIEWCSKSLLPGTSLHETAKRRLLVQRALDLLADQYTHEIGLAQLADSMGITPNYLSSEFNRVMGESFSHYVTRLRMKKADELMRQGGITVKEVAARVGYVSSRHFACLFKKHFGHVPSEHVRT